LLKSGGKKLKIGGIIRNFWSPIFHRGGRGREMLKGVES